MTKKFFLHLTLFVFLFITNHKLVYSQVENANKDRGENEVYTESQNSFQYGVTSSNFIQKAAVFDQAGGKSVSGNFETHQSFGQGSAVGMASSNNYTNSSGIFGGIFNRINEPEIFVEIIPNKSQYTPGETLEITVNLINTGSGSSASDTIYLDITLPENPNFTQASIISQSGFIQEPGVNEVPGIFEPGDSLIARNEAFGIKDSSGYLISPGVRIIGTNYLISGYSNHINAGEIKFIKFKINTSDFSIPSSGIFDRKINILARGTIKKNTGVLRYPFDDSIVPDFIIDQQGFFVDTTTIVPQNIDLNTKRIQSTGKILWIGPTYTHYDHSVEETSDRNGDGETDPYLTWDELLTEINDHNIFNVFANVGNLNGNGNLTHPDDSDFNQFSNIFVNNFHSITPPNSKLLAWVNARTNLDPDAQNPINFNLNDINFAPIKNNIVAVCSNLISSLNNGGKGYDGIVLDIEPISDKVFVSNDPSDIQFRDNLFGLLQSVKTILGNKILVFHAAQLRVNSIIANNNDPNKQLWSIESFVKLVNEGLVDYISINAYDYNNIPGTALYEPQNLDNRTVPFGLSSEKHYSERIKETIEEITDVSLLNDKKIILGLSASSNITNTHTIYETISGARLGVINSDENKKNALAGIALFQVVNGTNIDFGEWSAFDDIANNSTFLTAKVSSEQIGINGGNLHSTDGLSELNIPPNTLNQITTISIERLIISPLIPPKRSYNLVGSAYHLRPDSLQLIHPATFTINYDEHSLPVGMSEADLRMAQISFDGNFSIINSAFLDTLNNLLSANINQFNIYGIIVEEVTNIPTDISGNLPISLSLRQNYPNPFNPVTTIEYDTPKVAKVSIEIFNILGQRIRTLVNETKQAGSYSVKWNARNDFGELVPSGIYFYRMKTAGFEKYRKLLLLK